MPYIDQVLYGYYAKNN